MNVLDILKKHDDTSSILLYGNTTDLLLSRDLCFREFRVALADILHEAGYDNVVFYDSTNASGKFVYDDESAYYTGIAREEYEKKHGSAPSKIVSKTNSDNAVKKKTIKQFGMPRKKISQTASILQSMLRVIIIGFLIKVSIYAFINSPLVTSNE